MGDPSDAGFDRLRAAWPGHLADVRRIVLDNLGELDLPTFARAQRDLRIRHRTAADPAAIRRIVSDQERVQTAERACQTARITRPDWRLYALDLYDSAVRAIHLT